MTGFSSLKDDFQFRRLVLFKARRPREQSVQKKLPRGDHSDYLGGVRDLGQRKGGENQKKTRGGGKKREKTRHALTERGSKKTGPGVSNGERRSLRY